MLRDSKISNIKDGFFKITCHLIASFFKSGMNLINNRGSIWSCAEHPNNIFKHKKFWFEVFYNLYVAFKKVVSIIVLHPIFISNSTC